MTLRSILVGHLVASYATALFRVPVMAGAPSLIDWGTENANGSASHELRHRSSVPLAVISGIH